MTLIRKGSPAQDADMSVRLDRNGLTQVQARGVDLTGPRNQFLVNAETITLASPLLCNFGAAGDNLIEGGAPAVSTLYYLYVQNTAAGGPRLRASATVPLNGYRTGDADSRFVGAVWLDNDGGGNTQVTAAHNLCGYGEDNINLALAANQVFNAGPSQFTTLLTISNLVHLDTTKLIVTGKIIYDWNAAVNNFLTRIREATVPIDECFQDRPVAGVKTLATFEKDLLKSTIANVTYDLDFFYTFGLTITFTAGVTAPVPNSCHLRIRRFTE